MKHLPLLACWAALLGLGTPQLARAQMSTELILDNFTSTAVSFSNSLMLAGTLERQTGADKPASRAAAASFAYAPTPALRTSTVQRLVGRLRPKSPASAQAIATAFGPGKNDYGQLYHGIAEGSGLRENDAASVLATYLIMGWMIVHNVQDGKAITVPMAQGVRAQVAPLLAAQPALRKPGMPAQFGEELKLQTAVLYSSWQNAHQGGTLATYQQGIGRLFKTQYGLDLSRLKLTGKGFVKG